MCNKKYYTELMGACYQKVQLKKLCSGNLFRCKFYPDKSKVYKACLSGISRLDGAIHSNAAKHGLL